MVDRLNSNQQFGNVKKRYDQSVVLKIVGSYAVLGSLWILFSDLILGQIVRDPEVFTRLSVYKGWLFIAITSAILFLVIKKYVRELRANMEAIEELNILRSKFISIMAHQLRTPITTVNWNSEILLSGDFGELQPKQEKGLRAIYEASISLTRRLYDILAAINIEEGRTLVERKNFPLNPMCEDVMREYKGKAFIKDMQFDYISLAEESLVINGDSEKIKTVFRVLAENAVVYTREGGMVTAMLSRSGARARFEISDTGVGIPAAEQSRIFNRFFRASNASVMKPDAFGLGLFVVKYLVEQHGGAIGFTSEEGKGSTFWFELPVVG